MLVVVNGAICSFSLSVGEVGGDKRVLWCSCWVYSTLWLLEEEEEEDLDNGWVWLWWLFLLLNMPCNNFMGRWKWYRTRICTDPIKLRSPIFDESLFRSMSSVSSKVDCISEGSKCWARYSYIGKNLISNKVSFLSNWGTLAMDDHLRDKYITFACQCWYF